MHLKIGEFAIGEQFFFSIDNTALEVSRSCSRVKCIKYRFGKAQSIQIERMILIKQSQYLEK